MTWPAPCALVEEMKAKSIFRIFFVAFHIKFFSCCLPLKSNPCASIYSVNLSIIESSGPYTGPDQEGGSVAFKIFLFFKHVAMTGARVAPATAPRGDVGKRFRPGAGQGKGHPGAARQTCRRGPGGGFGRTRRGGCVALCDTSGGQSAKTAG